MSDHIKPALSASEWRQEWIWVQADEYESENNGAAEVHAGRGVLHITEHQHPRYAVFDTEQIQAALLALANHVLPSGSPYKITQADVDYLRDMAESPQSGLLSLADRLQALLPPKVSR